MQVMRGHRFYAAAALTALVACALIAAGCGDDDETTTTSVGENAKQTVDTAVASCTDEANQLGGVAGTALEGACTAVGDEANRAISEGGENVKQALSKAEKSCKTAVSQLQSGQAQDALTQLCDAISSAE
jgi:lipid-binding SYLF domain-containing protein